MLNVRRFFCGLLRLFIAKGVMDLSNDGRFLRVTPKMKGESKMKKENEVICSLCEENVGLPTKRGAHKASLVLPRLTAVLPPEGREINFKEEVLNKGSFRAPLRSGFTLIELLVVVLILGILVAVAVPQYQIVVAKTHIMRLMKLMQSIQYAQQEYYLTNGIYADDFDSLSIGMSANGEKCNRLYTSGTWYTKQQCRKYNDFSCVISSNDSWTTGAIVCAIQTPAVRLTSPFQREYWACWDDGDANGLAARVCKAISGGRRQSNGAWVFYK